MKKLIFLLIILCLLFSGCVMKHEKPVNEAYLSLKRLEAKTEVGISYNDYMTALGDAWFNLKIYLENKNAENDKPQLKELLLNAINKYKKAANIWRIQLSPTGTEYDDHMTRRGFPPANSEYGKKIHEIYPEAVPVQDGNNKKSYYYIKSILEELWKAASQDLQKAGSLINQNSH